MVSIGWQTDLLGDCEVESSSKNENYAIVCFENGVTDHAFLVSDVKKIGEIVEMWLMGSSAEEIDAKCISA